MLLYCFLFSWFFSVHHAWHFLIWRLIIRFNMSRMCMGMDRTGDERSTCDNIVQWIIYSHDIIYRIQRAESLSLSLVINLWSEFHLGTFLFSLAFLKSEILNVFLSICNSFLHGIKSKTVNYFENLIKFRCHISGK